MRMFGDLPKNYKRPVLTVFASIFFYICLQNFFKWMPFPAGRTAFNLTTLEENMVSVIAGLVLFLITMICLARPIWVEIKIRKQDWVVGIFAAFLIIQVIFRESKLEEFVRSLALAGSLLSSVFFGKYFAKTPERLRDFLRVSKYGLLLSVVLGLIVAITRPVAVNWGALGEGACTDAMICRAEFFFFTINPLILTVLLWRTASTAKKVYWLEIISGFMIFTLAMMTRTRQYTLTIIATTIAIFALWARDKKRVIYSVLAAFVLIGLFLGPTILHKTMQYARLAVDPNAVAVDPNTADWSSGRLELLQLLWKTYRESPIVGVGGVQIRALIEQAHLNARTEHGFAFYLATYGLFGLLFEYYIFWSFAKAVRVLWRALRGKIDSHDSIVTLALIAVPLFPFGFFGLFGSATNATDWFCLVIASLISQTNLSVENKT